MVRISGEISILSGQFEEIVMKMINYTGTTFEPLRNEILD